MFFYNNKQKIVNNSIIKDSISGFKKKTKKKALA